jgi:general secretion pathway protein G
MKLKNKLNLATSFFAIADREPGRSNFRPRQRGFTLIELLIVISIILILIGIAAGNYQRSLLRSKEAVLKEDLMEMRKAIDNYTMDKQAAPQSLDDLVPNYLHIMPKDPITDQKDWVPQTDSVVLTPDQTTTGITDVHSASEKVSPFEGTAYNTW